MGSSPARVEKILILFVTHSSYSTCPGLNKVDREALGDRRQHKVCMGDP